MELAAQLRIVTEGRSGFLLRDSSPTENPIMDDCLVQLKAKTLNHYFKFWLTRGSGFKDITKKMIDSHVQSGLLHATTRKYAFVFTKEVWDHPDVTLQGRHRGGRGGTCGHPHLLPF
jgi:hypothetical protein